MSPALGRRSAVSASSMAPSMQPPMQPFVKGPAQTPMEMTAQRAHAHMQPRVLSAVRVVRAVKPM